MQIKMWSETGAEATPIAFNKLYAALQNKTVRCSRNSIVTYVFIKVL